MRLLLCLLLALASAATAQEPTTRPDLAGEWMGEIAVPGQPLPFGVTLARDGEAWTAELDIPAQMLLDLPFDEVLVEGSRVRLATGQLPGRPTWEGTLQDDGTIAGPFKQGGLEITFSMKRGSVVAKKPQEPVEPLPYDVREVTFPGGDDGVTLAGTITTPKGDGPFPAAVLISGSGPQDRDESLLGHKPFLVLADRLTRAGIAVLRYDDRGTAKSTGDFTGATGDDFADDAEAAFDYLKTQHTIGPVGLIGHSEGGLHAPVVAARNDDVAFVVLLAGPGVPGREIVVRQTRDIAVAGGTDEAAAQRLADAVAALIAAVEAEDAAAITTAAAGYMRAAMGLAADAPMPPEAIGQAVAVVGQFGSPWMRQFLAHDPRPVLAKVKVPLLALNGELDVQVHAETNLAAIAEATKGSRDATVESLPGLNHLFQPATTGGMGEYATIDTTFDEAAMALIADWINSHFVSPGSQPPTRP